MRNHVAEVLRMITYFENDSRRESLAFGRGFSAYAKVNSRLAKKFQRVAAPTAKTLLR